MKMNGCLSFAKIMSKNTGKNLSGKHNQKILVHAKQSATYALKAPTKKQFKKQLKETGI